MVRISLCITAVMASCVGGLEIPSPPMVGSSQHLNLVNVPSRQTRLYSLSNSSSKNDEEVNSSMSSNSLSRKGFVATSFGFVASSVSMLASPSVVVAVEEDGDMTSQLFNADGSLKEGSTVSTEAVFRSVPTLFPATVDSTTPMVAVDGKGPTNAAAVDGDAPTVTVVYQTPEKWNPTEQSLYTDTSNGVNLSACNRIQVYQTKASNPKVLEKATVVGVAKSLQVPFNGINFNGNLLSADLVTGRKTTRDDIVYYDFDLAVAPATCGEGNQKSKEDLGLGFCPYDSVVLLSAAMVKDVLYVIQLECDRDQWRRSNADLKRVRQSFSIQV